MLKIFINGINGKMGKEVANLVKQKENMHLLGGYDRKITHNTFYKVFSVLKQHYLFLIMQKKIIYQWLLLLLVLQRMRKIL